MSAAVSTSSNNSDDSQRIYVIKERQIRTYYEDGFRKRAACLCFKDKSQTELLLISSNRYKDKWIIPGGGVEPNEDIRITATREVLEEAGALGKIERLLGEVENKDKKTRTTVFTFIVTDLSEEWEDNKNLGRQREWFTIEEAREKLAHSSQVNYLNLLTNPY
ncbi:hypothetical protein LOTGIDRAFT_121057 [Lottia gigantea]|uniref:diphosphoinositol-polyphosphate diphosphatase n=1 Tax=Lottia gigantea TaxID=225164 RepID=V3ZM39_LOTGI|nr:hypothetical protein LOTGIDRAFT_121057 [Lottia gigantea]ESO92418.1 hypothetical protein LOTGIDRAFT_121057 [Lottia gigantea]